MWDLSVIEMRAAPEQRGFFLGKDSGLPAFLHEVEAYADIIKFGIPIISFSHHRSRRFENIPVPIPHLRNEMLHLHFGNKGSQAKHTAPDLSQ
jgi:hypothetical protein